MFSATRSTYLDVDTVQLIVIGVVIVLAVESDVLRGHLEQRFRCRRQGGERMSVEAPLAGRTREPLTAPPCSRSRERSSASERYSRSQRQPSLSRAGEILALLGDNGDETHSDQMPERRPTGSTTARSASMVMSITCIAPPMQGVLGSRRSTRTSLSSTIFDATANFYAGREGEAGPSWLPRGMQFLRRETMDASTRGLLDRLKVALPRSPLLSV